MRVEDRRVGSAMRVARVACAGRPSRARREAWGTALAIIAIMAMLILSALAVGCGGDEVAPTSTSGATSTTQAAPTTTEVVSTTLSPSTTAPPEVTSTTASGETTTTEKLSSAETRLPNGNIKAMGFIDAVWEDDGVRHLSIDYAEMLTGQEAVEAAIEAGYLQPGEDLPNDYFIRNENAQKREFSVSDTAVITTSTFGGVVEGTDIDWDTFTSFWTEFTPEGGEHLSQMPWWIERAGQEVVRISEQYLP